MHIVVRRSGGFAGLTRSWRVDTESCEDPDGWSELVDALPREAPVRRPGAVPDAAVPDDFQWTITVARTTVRIPGSQLDGSWAALVDRVRDEGQPD